MTITASIVLFAIFWFILLFVTLPIKIKTQQETGKQTPGTPPSAPEDPQIKTKYFSRTSYLKLFKQYFNYGFYKVRVIQKRKKLKCQLKLLIYLLKKH